MGYRGTEYSYGECWRVKRRRSKVRAVVARIMFANSKGAAVSNQACPVLATFADTTADLTSLTGSYEPELQERRATSLAWAAVTQFVPLVLTGHGLHKKAAALSMAVLHDWEYALRILDLAEVQLVELKERALHQADSFPAHAAEYEAAADRADSAVRCVRAAAAACATVPAIGHPSVTDADLTVAEYAGQAAVYAKNGALNFHVKRGITNVLQSLTDM